MAERRIDRLAGVERERERYQDRGGWPNGRRSSPSRRRYAPCWRWVVVAAVILL